MNRLLHSVLLGFLSTSIFADSTAINSMSIKEDNSRYSIDIQYPQGFPTANVDSIIQQYANTQKSEFLKSAGQDTSLPANVPGKDSLTITYKTVYQNGQALSVLFDMSLFNRGAAHPKNNVFTLNFVNGKSVSLEQLFNPGSQYLSTLADLSRAQFSTKDFLDKNSDKKWIDEGTKPTTENYKLWYFSKEGLIIVFDTYQVAAYVYGPQTVQIPKEKIITMLKNDVAKAVWG